MDNFRSLKNKIILITGSSRGIGKKIATKFLENGAVVIGVSKNKNSNKIIKAKNKYQHFFCDLSKHLDLLLSFVFVLPKRRYGKYSLVY